MPAAVVAEGEPVPQDFKQQKAIESVDKFVAHCLENSPKFTGFLQFEFYGGELKKTVKHQEYYERAEKDSRV